MICIQPCWHIVDSLYSRWEYRKTNLIFFIESILHCLYIVYLTPYRNWPQNSASGNSDLSKCELILNCFRNEGSLKNFSTLFLCRIFSHPYPWESWLKINFTHPKKSFTQISIFFQNVLFWHFLNTYKSA